MNRIVDVVILGDGPAGCATALTLAAHGVRVAMVGLGKRTSRRLPENLGPDARAPLEKLGLWECFVAAGHPRCWAALSAWGSGELRERNSIRNASGAGWLIDRDRLDPWMRSACAGAGVPWFARCPSGLVERGSHWNVLLEGGVSVEAVVAVDAAGRHSRFACQHGAVREYPGPDDGGVCARRAAGGGRRAINARRVHRAWMVVLGTGRRQASGRRVHE